MKRLIVMLVDLLFIAACSGKGVEVTNPDLDLVTSLQTKVIRVVPSSGTDTYLVRVLDSSSAQVGKVDQNNVILDMVTAPVSVSNNRLEISVTISGMQVRIVIIGDGNGNITGIELYINNSSVDISYESEQPATTDATESEGSPNTISDGSDPDGGSGTFGTPETNAAIHLLDTTCNLIMDCFREALDRGYIEGCYNQLLYCTNIADNFGVPAAEGTLTMNLVINRVDSGVDVADETNLTSCINALNAMTCADVRVGYNPSDPYNYNNVQNIIPAAACGNVF